LPRILDPEVSSELDNSPWAWNLWFARNA